MKIAAGLAGPVRFSSGHDGYSVNRHKPGRGDYAGEARETMFVLSQRYRELDVVDPPGTTAYVHLGIKCVNWLTLLSQEQAAKAGGVQALRAALGEEITVHPLD